jgi:secondary thiamine-phosphate synthase enzyme
MLMNGADNNLFHYQFETKENGPVEITDFVVEAVKKSGTQEGICVITIPHTTASISITSKWDPNGLEDIRDEMDRLIPTRIDFKHQHDTPQDAAGHIKSVLLGPGIALIVHEGTPFLGHSQGIFFNEFDGPRSRKVAIKCMEG